MANLADRITIDPSQLHGRPCIRGLRISVGDVLAMLAAGMAREDILKDFPYLESADIDAVLDFAAKQANRTVIAAE